MLYVCIWYSCFKIKYRYQVNTANFNNSYSELTLSDTQINMLLQANLDKIRLAGRRSILPPADLTVSDWADANRMLPETSAEPGRWRTNRAPHSRAIMNAVNLPGVRAISVMGSSQIAKTEILNNIIGYHVDLRPCSIMVMQPTEKDAKDYVLGKLDPMFEDTPILRDKISRKKSRDSENSTFWKKFIGGWIRIISGNSTSSTRGRSAKLTIADDIDGIKIGLTDEGDPILRLIKRSTTFPDSLNVNISTPVDEGESRIAALYEQGNMQKFMVPCPYCGQYILLMEEALEWDKEKDMFDKVISHYPETVRYKMQCCMRTINEAQRVQMLQQGKWVAERPHIVHHQTFWINELSSSLSSMEKVARAIIDAGCDVYDGVVDASSGEEEKARALWNTVFGRVWPKKQGKQIDPLNVITRLEDYITPDGKIPSNVLLLTCGVDVQAGEKNDGWLEYKVMGWGKDEEGWVIDRGKVRGNIKADTTWLELDEILLNKTYYRYDDVALKVAVAFVDSGFLPETVYAYTTRRSGHRIFATKGAVRYNATLLPNKVSMVNKGRTPLIFIGTQTAKHELLSRIDAITEPGARYLHFAKSVCDADYFRQLTSEKAVVKRTGLVEYTVYEKSGSRTRNEAIDLMVYNYAAMRFLTPNWRALELNLDARRDKKKENRETLEMQQPQQPQAQQKSSRGSSYKLGVGSFVNSWK